MAESPIVLAGHQPNFLPWLGFFDKMARASTFVLGDDMQFVKQEFHNRTRIKTRAGGAWLSVPVSCNFGDSIGDARVSYAIDWRRKHVNVLRNHYGASLYFDQVLALYQSILDSRPERLAELNVALIRAIASYLGIQTRLVRLSELAIAAEDRDLKIIEQCQRLGASTYLAGSGGRNYMQVGKYADAGINVVFQDFEHPTYPQLWGEFVPRLSAIDLLFNCGPRSGAVISAARRGSPPGCSSLGGGEGQ